MIYGKSRLQGDVCDARRHPTVPNLFRMFVDLRHFRSFGKLLQLRPLRAGCDLARRDADGYLWFAGRTKDVIIRGGSNISPGEVENVLRIDNSDRRPSVAALP